MFFTISFSQSKYTIYFQDEIIDIPENIDSFVWSQLPEKSHFNNGYYSWVQFYETPSQQIQNALKTAQIHILEYIPHHTYLVYIPQEVSVSFLKNSGVRGIIPVDGSYKISKELNYPPFQNWAMEGEKILVTLQYHKNTNIQYVTNELAKLQIQVKQTYPNSHLADLAIPDNCIEELANLPFVKWIELIVAPSIPDDTRGRSLHRANGLDSQTSIGPNYTGAGVGVLVRDDGIVGPHIDFQGRLDNTYASGSNQTHGDGVAGIMAGAGNRNPLMRGMAAGANVYVSNYVSNFLDSGTITLINNGSVQITNSSYSNGCNDGYTTIANTVDSQMNSIESLMHVFSAGNSNNSNCGYGAGSQWGNITGGHKQSKNSIATANVFFDGTLVSSSSRGPAHDGRIKPDITANGQNQNSTAENHNYLVFGGTSGAAPGIAGVSAQLYELYSSLNSGNHPPAGLIKATLLNTANDYGNVGPDYKFGWGIINGSRAGKLIEEGRHLTDEVSQGNTNTHTINVPANTSQVRFMVYWNDAAAAPGANPALVNDLDLVVKNPSNVSLLPWILDPTPNPANLDTPATNGIDRLNNMEQVLINNPASGNYTLEVTGFNVPMGPQEYFIVYEIITEQLVLTYPTGGEKFVPGQEEAIHWDATNTTQNFLLEYSVNNGTNWTTIATVSNNIQIYSWTVPADISGEAKIRVTSGAFQDETEGTFSIARLTNGLQVTMVCEDEASFSWTNVADADAYDLYILGEKYMEVAGTSSTNTITVPITDPNAPMWYAVSAKNTQLGWEGRRNNAIFYAGGLLNCEALSVTNSVLDNVRVYPNPAEKTVHISLNQFADINTSITLLNTMGQTLYNINNGSLLGYKDASIDVSSYSSGIYFINIKQNNQNLVKKVVIK